MKTFMFPGQGSHSKGMGGGLFDEFKELTGKADKILGYSIKELCLEDPRRELGKTQFTQPALYVVNALCYYKKVKETGEKPDYVIGHSLGEFNALLAAECFDFEAGLKLVKKRGELMSEATEGGMAAILNASKEFIEKTLQENDLNKIDLANYNTMSQIVISGDREEIGKAQFVFSEGDVLYYPLNTSGAFHSRFMEPSRKKFESFIKKVKLSDLSIPVISNVTAEPYQNGEILANLAGQISNAVKWCDSVQYLLKVAEDSKRKMEFVEIGHGDVLTKIVAKIESEVAELKKSAEATEETSPQSQSEASLKVAEWNENHPVGTKVKSTVADYDELETRTEAVVLFGHRAAVYMKGYNGYFALGEVVPV